MTCLRAKDKSADLWHRRLGHINTSLLNKLIAKDLVCGLLKIKFGEDKVCDAYVKENIPKSPSNKNRK